MCTKNNYILKVDDETNKIMDVIKVDGDMDVLMSKSDVLNKHKEEGVHYTPFPHAKREPKVGNDCTREIEDYGTHPTEESQDRAFAAADKAIKLLMATDMTIKATHRVPFPGLDVEEARTSIHNCIIMLMSFKIMSEITKEETQEKRDAVDELFKKLGLKGE